MLSSHRKETKVCPTFLVAEVDHEIACLFVLLLCVCVCLFHGSIKGKSGCSIAGGARLIPAAQWSIKSKMFVFPG